ncbi:MAG: FmdB family transcriptional regulator [Actinomycetota bacterium]|nr:FmdB family transcriptional regulator [Actinomycetota bacterium]
MPTYVYRCAKCGEQLEAFQSFADAPLRKHSDCGGKLTKVLSAAGIVLKGAGFYKTDNRVGSSNGTSKEKTKEAASSNSGSSSGSDSSSSDSSSSGSGSSSSGSSGSGSSGSRSSKPSTESSSSGSSRGSEAKSA